MRILAHYALDEAERARLDALSASIMDCFSTGGYRRIALPVLQNADLYLDMAGEDIRERMFVFEDPAGAELCLRADLTIPVCRAVLDEKAPLPARLACLGPIFRFEAKDAEAPAELIQAGIEYLGASDALAAEVDVLGLARTALAATRSSPLVVEIGDVSLFAALLADLSLDEFWVRRLAYAYRHPSLLHPTLAELRKDRVRQSGTRAVMSQEEAERFVMQTLAGAEDMLAGRTIIEIAERLIDKAKAQSLPPPSKTQLDVIEAFLAIRGHAEQAVDRLILLGGKNGPFDAARKRIERCMAGVRAKLREGDELNFSAVLGRNFVYYTGFVFSLMAAGGTAPLAEGGRYDRLLSDLGSRAPIDAVGCALWPERVLAAEVGRVR